jgi:HEAT repeat protein
VLALLILAAGAMAGWSSYQSRSEHRLALGPASPDQERFFAALSARPDAQTFYKKLAPGEKQTMAARLAEHEDLRVAELAGLLLADFDPDARRALAVALGRLAARNHEAAISQLKHSGGFQRAGVFAALDSLGPEGVQAAAAALRRPESRTNAGAYLVQAGRHSVGVLLTALADRDKNVRLAAADALGKLGARESTPMLLSLIQRSDGADRTAFITALAGTGHPRGFAVLASTLGDGTAPAESRVQAALGLGRIGSDHAVRLLWRMFLASQGEMKAAAKAGLVLAGDAALVDGPPLAARLEIATEVRGGRSDSTILRALADPRLRLQALRAAKARGDLVHALELWLRDPSFYQDGELVAAAVEALASTDRGQIALSKLRSHASVGGFVRRQESLAREQVPPPGEDE